jgi:hypothetical protein
MIAVDMAQPPTKKSGLVFVVAFLAAIAMMHATVRGGTQRSDATAQAVPPGWRDATKTTLDLTLAGKHDEVIAIYENWVAKYPRFAEAHVMLAGAYEAKARDLLVKRVPDAGAAALKLFEQSAAQLRRAFALGGDPRVVIRPLIDIYGPLGLNRPDEQERAIRDAVGRYPADALAESEFIGLLVTRGEPIDSALASARTALAKDPNARLEYAESLLQRAQRAPEPYRRQLLSEAERIIGKAK